MVKLDQLYHSRSTFVPFLALNDQGTTRLPYTYPGPEYCQVSNATVLRHIDIVGRGTGLDDGTTRSPDFGRRPPEVEVVTRIFLEL